MQPHSADRPLGSVHLVVDLDAYASAGEVSEAVRLLLEAGLPSLQVRGPGHTAERIVRASAGLRLEAETAGCFFVVNGNADAARYLSADGLHLPARGPAVAEARSRWPALAIGASCHEEDELAAAADADWVLLSPVFPTGSKPGAAGMGLERLAELARSAGPPVYALGGITRENAVSVLATGVAGVAAIRGLRGEDGLRLLDAVQRWTGATDRRRHP